MRRRLAGLNTSVATALATSVGAVVGCVSALYGGCDYGAGTYGE